MMKNFQRNHKIHIYLQYKCQGFQKHILFFFCDDRRHVSVNDWLGEVNQSPWDEWCLKSKFSSAVCSIQRPNPWSHSMKRKQKATHFSSDHVRNRHPDGECGSAAYTILAEDLSISPSAILSDKSFCKEVCVTLIKDTRLIKI